MRMPTILRRLRRSSAITTLVVVSVAGIVMSGVRFVAARSLEAGYSSRKFALQSENRVFFIRREIESNLGALNALRGFLETTGDITDKKFQGYAKRMLESHPSLRAAEWLRKVTDEQRPAFEAELRTAGAPQPFISDVPPGTGKRAGRRDVYYPVRFLYPVNNANRTAIGFDFSNCKGCDAVLKTAEATDAPAATVKFRILEHTGDGYAVGILLPVRDLSQPAKPVAGFAVALLQVADVVERAIGHLDVQGINIQIFDESAVAGHKLLYFHPAASDAQPQPETISPHARSFEYVSTFDMGGRKWLVMCTPTEDYLRNGRTILPLIVLVGGLAVTVILALFFLFNVLHISSVEKVNRLLNEQIQERLKIEQELAAARDQALAASRMKSQFLATMSHEIRTPMNGVIGMTQLLLDTPLSGDQREYADSVRNSAEALLTVINDILDLSRIEAGRIAIAYSAFNLRQIVDEVLRMMAPKAHEKGIALHREVPECLPAHFLGDRIRIRQIMLNLVGNAVKFTRHGEVSVTVECTPGCEANAQPPCQPYGRKMLLRISVRDTGIGIPPEKLNLLFEKFSQIDSSDTREFGGTGLGLAISKELAELLGGSIGVESVPNQGSVFWFTLPLTVTSGTSETEIPAAPVEPDEVVQLQNPRTLVAEDNPINLRVATLMLAQLGIHADVAQNGSEAVRLFRAHHYEFILMDCQMPEKDGYAATREIREMQDPDRPPVIIALTADAMEGSRERCLGAGMDDYIAKPVTRDALIRTIATWARKKTAAIR